MTTEFNKRMKTGRCQRSFGIVYDPFLISAKKGINCVPSTDDAP